MEVQIKNASKADVESIAWVVCQAIDYECETIPADLITVCSSEDTLYSWTHARLLMVDGKVAGGYISYDGRDYMRFRENTLKLCPPTIEGIAEAEAECSSDEYYLDSMALLPAYRGLSLSRHLILDAIQGAKEKGYERVSLIAAHAKPGLVRYYESFGFCKCGSLTFFGEDYWRMRLCILPK